MTASTDYAPEAVRLARWCRALGHPARIEILRVLAARQTCICGELVDTLPLAQATVSQHLKALKDAGLICGTIDGPRSCYHLNPDVIADLNRALGPFLGGLDAAACGCR